MFLRIV